MLRDISLEMESGSYVVLLGKSGSGKTTILRIIAGLQRPDSGDILFDEQSALGLAPRDRDISLVVQQGGLYPHRTIVQSMRMPLQDKLPSTEIEARIRDAIRLTRIETLVDRSPDRLSGGELRRAAIAKAVARRASVRLLDEPLTALDGPVKEALQDDLLRWHTEVPGTTIHVTHDGLEAMRMADKIAVIDAGQIIQFAAPDAIYSNPASVTVAQSIGSPAINLLNCTVRDGQVHAEDPAVKIVWQVDLPDGRIVVGIRPDHFELAPQNQQLGYTGKVQRLIRLAGKLQLSVANHQSAVHACVDNGSQIAVGDTICLAVRTENAMVFDANTQRRLI